MEGQSVDELRKLLSAGTITIHGFDLHGVGVEESTHQGCCSLLVSTQGGRSVRLRFLHVRSLEIRTGPYGRIQVAGLEIIDMSKDQWPGVRYCVRSEEEQASFSVLCAEIEFALE